MINKIDTHVLRAHWWDRLDLNPTLSGDISRLIPTFSAIEHLVTVINNRKFAIHE